MKRYIKSSMESEELAYNTANIVYKRVGPTYDKWWMKEGYGQNYAWVVAEHSDYSVRLFFEFMDTGFCYVKVHFTNGAAYEDLIADSWNYARESPEYPFEETCDHVRNFLDNFFEVGGGMDKLRAKYEKGNNSYDVDSYIEKDGYVKNNRKLVKSFRRPIKSARYIATDPETGEVLGSADTYEEAVNEWGEDVTITDSEVSDNMDETQGGILSSKESNHQFNQRIVNSVLTKEITEDDAIKQIASRNNMNIGFAKRIFNNLMEDKSLIQSGVMEVADDINKDFDLNGDLYSWFDDYVEDDGKSTTVGGELVRAAHRIVERFENDGDKIGMGYGKETVNPAARYILAICNDYIDRNDIEEMLYNESRINYSDEEYEAWLQQFERTFEDYLRNHEELFHTPNKNDMWDYKEDDDVDSSVTECCIYDDNGNEYWFQKDDIGWKCTNVEMVGQDPEYNVNDTFTSGDEFESEIGDRREPYGYFSKDGFTYNWEGVGEPDDEGEYREWIITDVSLEDSLANVGETWQADDLGQYTVYDANGREINVSDLY